MEMVLSSNLQLAPNPDQDRRRLLRAASNTGQEHDILVTLSKTLAYCHVEIRYVPGKQVLLEDGSASYWSHMDGFAAAAPEELAAIILGDFNNEIVPRWLQVTVSNEDSGHRVTVIDQQPDWQNAGLLARLRPL